MTIKEKLIEELESDNSFIDTYEDSNRVASLQHILYLYTRKKMIPSICYFPMRHLTLNHSENEIKVVMSSPSQHKNLTNLFNQYLEECEPKVWLHSLLAARQLGLKVEVFSGGLWVDPDNGFSRNYQYRIDYKQPKLIDDDVWQFIDKKWNAIAMNKYKKVYMHATTDMLCHNDVGWYSEGDGSIWQEFTAHEYLTNIKLNDVPWEESLTVRPEKYR